MCEMYKCTHTQLKVWEILVLMKTANNFECAWIPSTVRFICYHEGTMMCWPLKWAMFSLSHSSNLAGISIPYLKSSSSIIAQSLPSDIPVCALFVLTIYKPWSPMVHKYNTSFCASCYFVDSNFQPPTSCFGNHTPTLLEYISELPRPSFVSKSMSLSCIFVVSYVQQTRFAIWLCKTNKGEKSVMNKAYRTLYITDFAHLYVR